MQQNPKGSRLHKAASRLGLVVLIASLVATCGAYDTDKLYKYSLEGSVAARVSSENVPQYAGLAIASGLHLQRSSSSELVVKLDQPKVGSFNELVEDFDHDLASKVTMEPLDVESSKLDKPFKVYLDASDFSVKSFDAHKDEPKWATNFKRGLMGLLSVKLQHQQQQQDQQASNEAGAFYTTTERSVFGECETDYVILHKGPQHLNVTKSRNLAKCKSRFQYRVSPIDVSECYEQERDMEQFRHSAATFNFDLKMSSPDTYVIESAQLDESSSYRPFGMANMVHQVLTKMTMKLTDAPSSAAGSLSVDSGATPVESLAYEPPEIVNFNANVNLEEDHYASNILDTRASVDETLAALDKLAEEHRAYATGAFSSSPAEAVKLQQSQISMHFRRLVYLLGTLNLSKIEQVYAGVEERSDAHKGLFWEVMPVVGTNPSFAFMKKLITDGDAPMVKLQDYISRVSFHLKSPNKVLFDEYLALCKSDKISAQQATKRTCLLPLASLINQHCVKPHTKYLRLQFEGSANASAHKRGQNVCQISTADEYFGKIVDPIASSSSSSSSDGDQSTPSMSLSDKMFNVKLAGEIGSKASVEYLANVIKAKPEHPSLRAAAMWGLSKAAKTYPQQVKKIVLPYYYEPSELLEVRVGAFQVWFATNSPGQTQLHELELMVAHLASEPNRQLVLYVHSVLESIANMKSPIPCMRGIDLIAKQVLAVARQAAGHHDPAKLSDSQARYSSAWLPEFGYGTTSLMSILYGNDSFAPINMHYSVAEVMSGHRVVAMQVSVQAHGLDKMLKRVLGIQGLFADKLSFMDVFSLKRRARRQAPAEAPTSGDATGASSKMKLEQQEIERELRLATREFSDVYLAITVHAYGRPVAFIERDSRELKKMVAEDGTIRIPHIKKLLHSFNNYTKQEMATQFERLELSNNELGLPLYTKMHDFALNTFKLNSVKLDVEPGLFKDERAGKPVSKLAIGIDAKQTKRQEFFLSTGVQLAHSKQFASALFHKTKLLQMPIKLDLELNLADRKLTLRREPIMDNLLYVRHSPGTMLKSYKPAELAKNSAPAEQASKATWRPLYALNDSQAMESHEQQFMSSLAIGLKLKLKDKASNQLTFASLRRKLAAIGDLGAIKFMYQYSPSGQPLEVIASTVTTPDNENPTHELVTSISWTHFSKHETKVDPSVDAIRKDLEQYTNAGGAGASKEPTTVAYELVLAGGQAQDRKLSVQVGYSRSYDSLLHKWRVSYARTPLGLKGGAGEDPGEVANLCWFGELKFPQLDAKKMLALDMAHLDQSVNMSTTVTFDADTCNQEAQLSARSASPARPNVHVDAKVDWSAEQRNQLLSAAEGAAAKGTFAQLRAQCERSRTQDPSNPMQPACLKYLSRATQLNHLEASIEHHQIPARWTKYMSVLGYLYTMARAGYIDDVSDAHSSGSGSGYSSGAHQHQGKSLLVANMTERGAQGRALDYQVESAGGLKMSYKDLPWSLPGVSTSPLLGNSYYQSARRSAGYQTCQLGAKRLITYDNVSIELPTRNSLADGCMWLVASDCSPEHNYVVLAAPSSADQMAAKQLRVYLGGQHRVDFRFGASGADVQVNGVPVKLAEDGPSNYGSYKQQTSIGPNQVTAFNIDYNGAFYTLTSKLYRFAVISNGQFVMVQHSKYYMGKSCGICSDSNGDQLNELASPKSPKLTCPSQQQFLLAHVLPSTCPTLKYNSEC